MSSIEQCMFRVKQTERHEIEQDEPSVLSLVDDGPTDNFIELRKRMVNEIGGSEPRRKRQLKMNVVEF